MSRRAPRPAGYLASQRARMRQRLTGIDREEQDRLFRAQGGVCAACRTPFGQDRAHLDHSHETGRVRGFLCRGCNIAAGHLRDSPSRCEMLAAYLRSHAAY